MKITNLFIISIIIIIIIIILLCLNNKEYFNNNDNLIYYFSLSTCPHCIEFDKTWTKFENNKCIKHTVDKNKNSKELANKFNVNSYPTIIVSNNNNDIIEEINDRSCSNLKNICLKHNIT
jgi:glutaredoxin